MKPDYHNQEEFQKRSQKVADIRSLGVSPYPHSSPDSPALETLQTRFANSESFSADDAAQSSSPLVCASGRLVLFRAMGKNAFAHIQDDTGKFQLMFNRELTKVAGLGEDEPITPLKFIEKKLDLGDIIYVEGHIFRTKKEELTIYVKTLTLLSKALLPLPDKYSGLQDKGVRYHKRWLDLIANPSSMERLKMRSKIVHSVRSFMHDREFLEVETPILQSVYGGAEASPFKTVLQAEHKEMYLRIALEISLKKLLVGGLPKIYEIGKTFRNEGIDRTHNPEFTMLEAYAAFWDYHQMMDFVEKLFQSVAKNVLGKTSISVDDESGSPFELSFASPWKKMSMKESIQVYANIDFDALSDQEISEQLTKRSNLTKEEIEEALPKNRSNSRGPLMALVFEELVEKHLVQPHHITDHPVETTPFCKPHRSEQEQKEGLVERFESFILGTEIINAYSELNDPLLQRALLEEQQTSREEHHPIDEDFIEAMCQGMPPAGGIGIGIDRLVMLLTKAASIKDVLFFPL